MPVSQAETSLFALSLGLTQIWYDEEVHDLRSAETKFPAIIFNDNLTSNETLSCEPTVSSLNDNEMDFRISFDESDDEDYTLVFDKNSFSYKIISTNDLKMDSENDNEKVNMPSFPSPEPTVSYFNDLDFFKEFENEFPTIVYNDALTSKSDLLTEPTISPQHIDEFNLKDETSLSECDKEEQNVLNFNDLFSFNVIYPNDSKSDKDNDDDKVDIEHSSGDLSVKPLPDVINTDVGAYAHGSNKLLETSHDTSNKIFKTETFIKELKVNIMTWDYLNKGMPFSFLIKNFDHNLWNIVLNGNSRKRTGRDPKGNIMILPPVSVEEQIMIANGIFVGVKADLEEMYESRKLGNHAKAGVFRNYRVSESEVLENVLHYFVAESDPQQGTHGRFDQIGKIDLGISHQMENGNALVRITDLKRKELDKQKKPMPFYGMIAGAEEDATGNATGDVADDVSNDAAEFCPHRISFRGSVSKRYKGYIGGFDWDIMH
ncbi:hypothetical protein Tco_1338441 [Tanacetum coccineum]